MPSPLPIPFEFYLDDSLTFSAQRLINWIPIVAEAGALTQRKLAQPSGVATFATTGLGPCRGKDEVSELPFFVYGNSLVEISSTGGVTDHGAISGTKRVVMANNGTKLVIVVPGGDSYVFDTSTSALTQIVDPDFQVSDTVSFNRGFFVFTASDGKQFFVSNLNQPLTFDALDFGSAEGDPDRIVTQIVDHDELSIIGFKTTEVFRLIGGADFPYQIIPGAFTEKGSHSKYGVAKFDNTYLFIGGGDNELTAIWRQTSSASAVKISTNTIDTQIQRFTKEEIAEAFTMTFSKKGQFFAVFTFNSNRIPGRTFVFNGTASALMGKQIWFEIQSGLEDGPWRVNAIVKSFGKLLVGDSIDGRVGEFVDNDRTEYGNVILRQGTTQPFSQDGTEIFAGDLEATFQAGVGLTQGQGSDPVAIMEFSDDGGHTFKGEFKRKIGKIGQFGQRSVWTRQGSFPDSRVIRLTVTDPVNATLIRLTATPELGT